MPQVYFTCLLVVLAGNLNANQRRHSVTHLQFERLSTQHDGPLNDTDDAHIYRAKVQGGWLVMSIISDESASSRTIPGIPSPPRTGSHSITFVPDPGHTWDGGSNV
jgi:hypothetical protein